MASQPGVQPILPIRPDGCAQGLPVEPLRVGYCRHTDVH